VIIYHAGSLSNALGPVEKAFVCQTGIQVIDCRGGSLDLAKQVTAGGYAADIYAPADHLDIELFLKPAGYADYNILIARGKMVLAYTTDSIGADKIAGSGTFSPPSSGFVENSTVPDAAANWYSILTQPGVVVGGGHPYLDPGAYRAPLMFQLAENFYKVPNLYNDLLEHHLVSPATPPVTSPPAPPSRVPYVLGTQYDYSLTYEHSAEATAKTNNKYRYVNLPDDINLGNSEKNDFYRRSVIVVPGLRVPRADPLVKIPGARLMWGATVLETAPNEANAIRFLEFLLGPTGEAALNATGPAPINPALVSNRDYGKLPHSLRPLVKRGDVFEGGRGDEQEH
jgi:molybdate/tungstate transport system substrate-binding protein